MTGATEATLAELLRVAQAQQANMETLNSLLARATERGGGGGGGGGGFADMAKNIPGVNIAFDILGGVAKVVGAAFEILGNIVGKVVGGFTDTIKGLMAFTHKAMEGTARLSDLYEAFSKLPFFLGEIASGFSYLLKILEKLSDEYTNLTNAGASFGGDIMGLRSASMNLGIGFDKLQGMVTKNSETFAQFGGGVTQGVRKFVSAVDSLMGPDSKYSQAIYALGMGTAEAAEFTITAMKLNQTLGKDSKGNSAALVDATGKYILELDALAKSTGMHRDQINAQLNQLADDQVFNTFMDGLDQAQRTNVQKMYAVISSELGKDAADKWFKNIARGIDAPLNDFSSKLGISSQGMSMQVGKAMRNLFTETDPKKFTQGLYKQLDLLTQGTARTAAVLGKTGQAFAGDMLDQGSLRFQRKIGNYTDGVDGLIAANEKEYQEQLKRAAEAAALKKADESIKRFGNQMTILLARLAEMLLPTLIYWGEKVMTWMSSMASEYGPKLLAWLSQAIALFDEYVMPKLRKIGDWISETWNQLVATRGKGPDEFFRVLKERAFDGMKNVMDDIRKLWNIISPEVIKIWNNDIKPWLISMWETLFKSMMDSIKNYLFGEKTDTSTPEGKQKAKNLEEKANYNWSQMSVTEKGMTAFAAGLESFASIFTPEIADRIRNQRITDAGREIAERQNQAFGVRGRASGGIVNPGTYLVGERGPELLTVGDRGNVITNENLQQLLARMASNGNNKDLTTLLEALNNTMNQIAYNTRDTADYARRTAGEIAGLNSNILPQV